MESLEQALFLELLQREGHAMMLAGGRSMRPWIAPNAQVHIASCHAHDVRLGDVLLAKLGTRLVLHRLIAYSKHTPHLILKGDASLWADTPIPYTDIVGRLVHTEKGWSTALSSSRLRLQVHSWIAFSSWVQWRVAVYARRVVP